MEHDAGGIRLLVTRETTIPRWLRRAMRRDAGIRWGYARMRRRRVRCLVIPHAHAHIAHGGSIELRIPGEVAFQNGLHADSVLEVQDIRGRTVIVNLLLCHQCLLPTGVRVPGSDVIRCASCGGTWSERERTIEADAFTSA